MRKEGGVPVTRKRDKDKKGEVLKYRRILEERKCAEKKSILREVAGGIGD